MNKQRPLVRGALRVALVAGVLAMGSAAGVAHAADDWTNGNPALSPDWTALAPDWAPDLPPSAQPDATPETAPSSDDWTNGNPALSPDWTPDLPPSAQPDEKS